MSKELVISANRHETKVAILEDDQLVEVFFQRANEYSLAGSIHKGRVTRVLPGMQSAFVDLGLERDTFLYVSDFFEENEEFDRVPVSREGPTQERPPRVPEVLEALEEPGRASEPEAPAAIQPDRTASAVSASAVSTPPSERIEEGDRGDRRGRRSRRRRNRGRGFPDSKYASDVSRSARPAEAPAPVAEPERERESRASEPSGGDFALLPGESLAKYTRANIQPLDDAEEEEIRSLQQPGDEGGSEPTSRIGSEEAEEFQESPDVSLSLGGAAAVAEEYENEPRASSPSSAAATARAASPETFPEEVAAPAGISDAVEGSAEAEESEASVDAATQAEGEIDAGAADETEEIPAAHGQSEGAGSPAGQLTAQVREPGGRYMHRLPRRMRRKLRGGAPGDAKAEPETRAAAAASPAGAPSTAATEPIDVRPDTSRTMARPAKAAGPSITELLKEGQEIIVQIAKEPLGQKGARITSHIALPGRYVVYMPTLEHTGVSRKIASDEERQRLKRILQIHHAGVPGGFIVRTAGEGKSEDELASDMNFLFNLWLDIRQKAEKKPAPVLLHHDLDIVQRILRDQFTEQFKAIWVDNEEIFESILRFVQRFQPSLVNRVKLYTRPEPVFDAFGVTAELEKALRPKVWLKSGGYIVINQTEALVAIDVNTGKYVGRSNRLEDTIVKTNTEAVKEIVRQVRLRDLGGIIVVDFIDMDERKNRQKVMQALEDAMRADHAPYKILQFNDFGLVAITRKRVKQSLERALCMPCPYCEGAGYVKSVQTILGEILQEAHKIAPAVEGKDVILRVNPDVAKVLKSHQNKYLEELEEILRRPVLVKGDPLLQHEKFDLA
jgi:Rne/Rng family ribonuclease